MEKIQLKTKESNEIVSVGEICRIEADGNYSIVHLESRELRIGRQIGYFEDQLRDCDFIRVHNSHLVNLKRIKSVKPGKSIHVELDDGTILPVSEGYRRHLSDTLSKEFKKI